MFWLRTIGAGVTEPMRMEVQVWELLDAPGVVNIGASWGANSFRASVHDRDPSAANHHAELATGLRASLGGERWGSVTIDVWEDDETGDVCIALPDDHGLVTWVNDHEGDPRCHIHLTRMLRLALSDAREKEDQARRE